jgi:hypothetical protein
MTGDKVGQTSLGVALAVPKSPKRTFNKAAAPAAAKSCSSDCC